jgi:hypothetical protein
MRPFGSRGVARQEINAYLAATGEYDSRQAAALSDRQARRMFSGFRVQEWQHLPFNKQAARGHVGTPEHPDRQVKRPAAEIERYRARYTRELGQQKGERFEGNGIRTTEQLRSVQQAQRAARELGELRYGRQGRRYTKFQVNARLKDGRRVSLTRGTLNHGQLSRFFGGNSLEEVLQGLLFAFYKGLPIEDVEDFDITAY